MKEGVIPMYSKGFSMDELKELAAKSDAYVEHLKLGFAEHLHAKTYDEEPNRAFKRMRLDGLEYYEKEEKRPRPMFQKDVLWAMYTHPRRTDEWKEFVSERI